MSTPEGRAFQAEGAASAKALRWGVCLTLAKNSEEACLAGAK